jgi:small-conductance mechanosensitive channel
VTSDINRAINAAFTKQGIEIPFPQRDVHFRGPLQIERDSGLPPEAPDGGMSPQL